MKQDRTRIRPLAFSLVAALLIAAAPAPKSPQQSGKPQPSTSELQLVRVKASWGPEEGPDGKKTSANTAVIPKEIMDVVMTDVNTWYALDFEGEARATLLQAFRKHFAGHGPSAGFRRVETKQGTIEIKDPRIIKTHHFMGGKEQPFEFGCWQPEGDRKTKPRKDGYEWTLPWMMQIRWEKEVRRYRVDVNLVGTLDPQTGGIKYEAVWSGPFKEPPIDLPQLRSELKNELK